MTLAEINATQVALLREAVRTIRRARVRYFNGDPLGAPGRRLAYRPRAKTTPTCGHPERKHHAHGQCKPCYLTQHPQPPVRLRRKALCHPAQPHYAKGQCAMCYYRAKRKAA